MHYTPADKTFSFSLLAWYGNVGFWLAVTFLGAVHCYFYALLVNNKVEDFLSALGWLSLRWPLWIFFTPYIAKLTCRYLHHKEQRPALIKQFALVVLLAGSLAAILLAIAKFASPQHSGAFFKLFYLALLKEVPLASMVTVALTAGFAYWHKCHQSEQTDALVVTTSKGTCKVETAALVHVKAAGNFMELHTQDGQKYLYRSTLKQLQQKLNQDIFVQVHRSALVNKLKVVEVLGGKVDPVLQMSNGEQVCVSRSFAKQFRDDSRHSTFKQAFLAN